MQNISEVECTTIKIRVYYEISKGLCTQTHSSVWLKQQPAQTLK